MRPYVLDCPFCGSQPAFVDLDGGRIKIECQAHDLSHISAFVIGDAATQAADRWNRRRHKN
jgi:hypothetical protein